MNDSLGGGGEITPDKSLEEQEGNMPIDSALLDDQQKYDCAMLSL